MSEFQASAAIPGPSCCQRECWQALRQADRLSRHYLLPAAASLTCQQWQQGR